ncbi:ABC transporter permease [Kaistia adipata]|uniref:ABC transporter permease n=1 Tax=Kaistia adipata TaxID=166954 RepID=UPI00041CB73B|nr:ABC transporter permease [Kaistia adipata]
MSLSSGRSLAAQRETPILAFFVFIILVLSFSVDGFASLSTFDNVSRQIAVICIMSVGMTLVIITGGIDLSVGAVMAFATSVGGSIAIGGGWPIWLAYPLMLGIGLGLGLINGLLVIRFAVHPLIVTLGTMSIVRGATMVLTGGKYITPIPGEYLWIGSGYAPVILLVVVLLLAHFTLTRTRFGRNLYAIGGNADAASFSGVPVDRYRVWVYVASGGLAALAGLVLVGRSGFVQPQVAFDGYEMSAIAAVVIGGASIFGGSGSVLGTLLGAAILGVILAGMTMLGIDAYWQGAVQGFLIIVAISLEYLRQQHAALMQRHSRRAAE